MPNQQQHSHHSRATDSGKRRQRESLEGWTLSFGRYVGWAVSADRIPLTDKWAISQYLNAGGHR